MSFGEFSRGARVFGGVVLLCGICGALDAADPRSRRAIHFSDPRQDATVTNVNSLQPTPPFSDSLDSALLPEKPIRPGDLGPAQFAPLPRPLAPQIVPSRRAKEQADIRRNWVFAAPEDLMLSLMGQPLDRIPEYTKDSMGMSSLSISERFFERIARGATYGTNAAPQRTLFDDAARTGNDDAITWPAWNASGRPADRQDPAGETLDRFLDSGLQRDNRAMDIWNLNGDQSKQAADDMKTFLKRIDEFKKTLTSISGPGVDPAFNDSTPWPPGNAAPGQQFGTFPQPGMAQPSALSGWPSMHTPAPVQPNPFTPASVSVIAPVPSVPLPPERPLPYGVMAESSGQAAAPYSPPKPPKPDFSAPRRLF